MTPGTPSITELVDASTAGNPEPHEVSRLIREGTTEGEEEVSRPFVFAFGYMDVAGRKDELRASVGGPFGPMIEMNGMSFPPPLSELEAANLPPLAEYLEDDKAAVARARLADLLWVKRYGDAPHLYAQAAIAAYLDLLTHSNWADVRKSDAASRAVELAAEINDAALIEKAVRAAIDHADGAIDDTENWNPGVPLFVMRELVDLKASLRPKDELKRLVEKARARYGADPWILEDLNQMAITLGGDTDDLDRASVEGFIERAQAASGLTRLMFLQKAYEKAANAGLADLRDRVGLMIQGTELSEDDFAVVSAGVEITKDEFDKALRPVVQAAGLAEAIRRLALYVLPNETIEETRAAVEAERAEHVISTLITKVRLGTDNALEIGPSDPAEQQIEDETARRALSLAFRAIFAAKALDRIFERFAGFDQSDVVEIFQSDLVSRERAIKFARSFELYGEGEYDDAVHVAVPRIEGALRDLARALGVRTSRVTPDPNAGEALSLGAVLSKLDGRMDEALRLQLFAALADKRGKNLRNVVSHALEPEFSREDAALVLALAALISGFEIQTTTTDK